MTLGGRNALLLVGTIVVLGWVVAVLALTAGTVEDGLRELEERRADSGRWLFFRWQSPMPTAPMLIGAMAFIGAYAVVSAHGLRRYFRRSSATEVFFFSVFALAVAIDLGKLGVVAAHAAQQSQATLVLLSRVVHFGRLLGMFLLFFSSLYAAGVEYQKHGIVLLASIGLAAGLAAVLPVDTAQPASNLVYGVDGNVGYTTVITVVYALTIANYLYGVIFRSTDLLVPTICLAVVIAGRELVFVGTSPTAVISGSIMLVVGTFLIGNRYHHMYLWT